MVVMARKSEARFLSNIVLDELDIAVLDVIEQNHGISKEGVAARLRALGWQLDDKNP